MGSARDEEFQDFVRRRRAALLNIATALTGGDRHLAEDLVQVCLTKLYLAWPRIRPAKLDGYARRVLVNALIDEKRGVFRRREQVWADVPDRPQSTERDGDRYGLLEALGQVPPVVRDPEATPRGWRARAQITTSDSVKAAPLATRFADHIRRIRVRQKRRPAGRMHYGL
jgi:DNA-directed RNA polymerase specialized sigma24 family protein